MEDPRSCARAAILVAGLAALIPATAGAQVFGQYTGAQTMPVNGRMFGAYLRAGDDVLGAIGQLRMTFFEGIEFGFQGGASELRKSPGDPTAVSLGTDAKVAVTNEANGAALSFAFQGALGLEESDGLGKLELGPGIVASRTFRPGGNVGIVPYASMLLAVTAIHRDSADQSDVSTPLRVGASFTLGPHAGFMMEMQLLIGDEFRDDYEFGAGLNLGF